MEELKNLKLSKEEIEKLEGVLTESKIIDLKYIQNKVYIFLMNSKIVVLKNSNLEVFNVFEKIQKQGYFKKSSYSRVVVSEWTNNEIEFLREHFFIDSLEYISEKIQKSFYQISLKAMELKLINKREWLDEEIDYLKKNINESNYELARHLKRSLHSIKSKKRVLNRLKIS